MNVDNRIKELETFLKDNQVKLDNYEKAAKDDKSLDHTVNLLRATIKRVNEELSILKKLSDLDRRYSKGEPIIFHYTDGNVSDDISLTSNDVNYEKAYTQQRRLLGLELRHHNRQSISDVEYGSPDYEKVYNQNRNAYLEMIIDPSPRKTNVQSSGSHFKKDDSGNNIKSDSENKGAHFKDSKIVDNNIANPYVGGRHFKANQVNSPFVEFVKDGCGYIVGNFTGEFLDNNFNSLNTNLLNSDIKEIRLINNIHFGTNRVEGLDGVKINVSKDGDIEVNGNVENLKYHNSLDKEAPDNSKENLAIVKVSDSKSDSKKNQMQDSESQKDMSGLDKIPVDDLSRGSESMQPAMKKVVKRSIKTKITEKWKSLKRWQKALIIAGVIAVVGSVGVFVVAPAVTNLLNQINPENVNTIHNTVNTVHGTMTNASNAAASLDYSGIGEGQTVFSNAYDAANNANGVISNEWFSNNPLDVFNTATHSYMGLTPEQLNDPSFMAELAKDPNNTMLFGNSMSDPSGFVGLDDVVNTVTKIR